ncbi:MAG TPA: hypothetical protein VMT10_11345 [Solirubrobacteraceae bacterium]|nr:hypothetical protein [Solirubrobacteraceae bacterium]
MSAAASRLRAAWRELFAEQRLAAIAAIGLIVSMFLPWYQQTGFAVSHGTTTKVESSLSAFQSWGFVEGSILLVAIAVLVLLFARAERRAFHLPFGDGIVLVAAGGWVMFLVFYREVDKPSGSDTGALKTTIGVNWGIFVAFLLGALLAYAGWRIHARQRPEPRVDGDDPRTGVLEGDPTASLVQEPVAVHAAAPPAAPAPPVPSAPPTPPRRGRRQRRRDDGQFEGQLSFDDPDAP